jgi:hypothetical protein
MTACTKSSFSFGPMQGMLYAARYSFNRLSGSDLRISKGAAVTGPANISRVASEMTIGVHSPCSKLRQCRQTLSTSYPFMPAGLSSNPIAALNSDSGPWLDDEEELARLRRGMSACPSERQLEQYS